MDIKIIGPNLMARLNIYKDNMLLPFKFDLSDIQISYTESEMDIEHNIPETSVIKTASKIIRVECYHNNDIKFKIIKLDNISSIDYQTVLLKTPTEQKITVNSLTIYYNNLSCQFSQPSKKPFSRLEINCYEKFVNNLIHLL